MAARLRCRLFAATIVQDIAFFDANKTGEIVNRCHYSHFRFKLNIFTHSQALPTGSVSLCVCLHVCPTNFLELLNLCSVYRIVGLGYMTVPCTEDCLVCIISLQLQQVCCQFVLMLSTICFDL